MRIAIDIDGVLTDIEQWQLDYGSKFYFEKYRKEILNSEGYETTDIFKVDNINKISTRIPVICFHAGYNKNCMGDNIIRCYSWYDIYSKINKMVQK